MNNQFFYKNNRIQQLRGFYNVVQFGGVSAAAREMNLTQSAVTQQIQSLERDVGKTLLDRTSRKTKLTKEGKLLYSQSVLLVQGINDLFESFHEYTSNKNIAEIKIASNHAGISYILPKYISEFKKNYPNQKIKLYNLSIKECEKKLLNNEIDFFLYPITDEGIKDEFEFTSIVKYNPIVLMSKDNPLSNKEEITLADISKENLLRIDPDLITLPGFEVLLKSHKIRSSIEFINSDWEILRKYVKVDLGVAMISSIILEGEYNNDYVQKDITNYFPTLDYGIYIKKGKILHGSVRTIVKSLQTNKLLQPQH